MLVGPSLDADYRALGSHIITRATNQPQHPTEPTQVIQITQATRAAKQPANGPLRTADEPLTPPTQVDSFEGPVLTDHEATKNQAAIDASPTDEGEVKCICGVTEDDGEQLVCCDLCNVWQHTSCTDQPAVKKGFSNFDYTCSWCKESKVPTVIVTAPSCIDYSQGSFNVFDGNKLAMKSLPSNGALFPNPHSDQCMREQGSGLVSESQQDSQRHIPSISQASTVIGLALLHLILIFAKYITLTYLCLYPCCLVTQPSQLNQEEGNPEASLCEPSIFDWSNIYLIVCLVC